MTRKYFTKNFGLSHLYVRQCDDGPRTSWRHGAAHLYCYGPGDVKQQQFGLEWNVGSHFCGVELALNAVDGDHGIRFFVGIPWLLAVWFTVHRVPQWMLPGHIRESVLHKGEPVWQPEKRNIGVRVHDWAIWFAIWENEMEWSSTDPWWQHFNLNIPDLVLGKSKFTRLKLAEGEIGIPMPEGPHPATWRISNCTWKRPRWPWPRRKLYVKFSMEEGIPLPGKGENSYDCDDDMVYSTSRLLDKCTVEQAAADVAAGIVRDRVRLCGREIYP